MNNSIALKAEHIKIVQKILKQYLPEDAKIWFFGSRTQGLAKPFSDIDLLIDLGRPLSLTELSMLILAFDESELPYKVDIADAAVLTDSFKMNIQDQLVLLQ